MGISLSRTWASISSAIAGLLRSRLAGVLAPLADPLALVGVPGAELFDDVLLGRHIDQLAFLGDARAVEDIELGLA